MATENKIFIVEKHLSNIESAGKAFRYWGDVIAMYNFCKCPELDRLFKRDTDTYIYAEDGDTRITVDRYNNPLREADISKVIKAVKKIIKHEDYWRLKPLLSLLKSVEKHAEEPVSIGVLHYCS